MTNGHRLNDVGLRRVEYRDADGRLSLRLIPAYASDDEALAGVLIGPPLLDGLGLPLDQEVRLNNELYVRGLFTEQDIRRNRALTLAAIMAANRADLERLLEAIQVPPSAPAVKEKASGNTKRKYRAS